MTQTEALNGTLPAEIQHGTLLHLLANSLILGNTAPYLSCFDLLNLAAASRTLRFLVYHTPLVFRRLDLRHVRNAQFDVVGIDRGGETWRNTQLDEALTEDDFYSGPLRGIFHHLRRADILRDVQVLSLDGLSVTAELVHNILVDASYSVRILSIRDAKNLNERKLRGALQYACRESRPKGMPRLRGLYVFGAKDADQETFSSRDGILPEVGDRLAVKKTPTWIASPQADAWYTRRGSQFPRCISRDWASTLVACDGIIAFDTVLCTGPRHVNSPAWGSVNIDSLNAAAGSPAASAIPHFGVATHSLGGCASCGSAPEGWTVWGESVSSMHQDPGTGVGRFPLLSPPPLHSAELEAAMCPAGQPLRSRIPSVLPSKATKARFIPRCFDCLRDRHCNGCHKWWCESCYIGPLAPVLGSHGGEIGPDLELPPVIRDCWECGQHCRRCIENTQRQCKRCGGGYCLTHNEGSGVTLCDWCSGGNRHVRELY